MKTFKKVLASTLAAAMVVTALPVTPANAAASPKLSTTKTAAYVGQSKTIKLTTPKSWKSVKTSVSSNKKSVATVKKASTKKFTVKAVKKGTAKITVKVTGRKSGKKVSKTLKATVTVKNPTLSVSVASKKMVIGEKMAIKTKKTPSTAKVTYSTNDASIASVYDGTITANGVGTATITAKMTCGTKTITKTMKITVVAGLEDGITATLTNPISDEYPTAAYYSTYYGEGTADFRLYYGKNGKGVADTTLSISATVDGQYGKSNYVTSTKTDADGLATFSIPNNRLGVASVDYTVTVVATGEKKTGTAVFASVSTNDITNVNGLKIGDVDYDKAGYKALKVSDNDKTATNSGNGKTASNGTYTTYWVNANEATSSPAYYTEYVDSQQVSVDTEHQVGFIGGLPYITLPGKASDLNDATKFEQNVGVTSNEYHTYANDSKYIELSVDPSELTYATMNFSSLKLSQYTALEIETYTSKEAAEKGDATKKIGTTTRVSGPHDQSNFSYQIPLTTKGSGICIKVTLKAAGQVNTDMNKGYSISNITGVYKNKTADSGLTTVPMKGAKITWATTTAKFSEERDLDAATAATLQKATNVALTSAQDAKIAKTTYRVPVFPYTGNAVITTYDKNNKVIAYYACPTINDSTATKRNTNTLDTDAEFVYQISAEEAFNSVGEITSQKNDLVTVNSKLAGTTNLVGTITGIEGLDATSSTVYTSVQWNPVNVAAATTAHSGAIAFAGQNVDVVAQLTDGNGNAVSTKGAPITFSVGDNSATVTTAAITNGQAIKKGSSVAVVKVDTETDTKGQAKLTLNAADVTTLVGITASTSNKSYKVVLTIGGQNVEVADLYWIDAKTQFTPSYGATAITDKLIQNKATAEVGENWEYGFKLQDETLVGGVFNGNNVSIENANIGMAVVKSLDDAGNKVASVGTANTNTGVNGMATATSTKAGKTTFEATVDGSAISGKTVRFTVTKGSDVVGTFDSVGTGKTSFVNKQDLEVKWATKGMTASFDTANGMTAATSGAFDVYFKVADTLGNKLPNAEVTVKSDKTANTALTLAGATTHNAATAVKTDANGLVKITVPATDKKVGEKEVITATVDGTAYTTTITWANGDAVSVNTSDRDSSTNKLLTNWSGDTITLTFNQDILASSVDASQFTATYDSNEYAIESVKVDGNTITLKVKNGPSATSINKDYTVNIKAIKKDGVIVSAKTVNGVDLMTPVSTTTAVLATVQNIAK